MKKRKKGQGIKEGVKAGKNIRRLRLQRGWSQYDFGQQFDPPMIQSHISDLERDVDKLGLYVAKRMAIVFECSLDDLVGYKAPKKEEVKKDKQVHESTPPSFLFGS